jgi:hypothetical protein
LNIYIRVLTNWIIILDQLVLNNWIFIIILDQIVVILELLDLLATKLLKMVCTWNKLLVRPVICTIIKWPHGKSDGFLIIKLIICNSVDNTTNNKQLRRPIKSVWFCLCLFVNNLKCSIGHCKQLVIIIIVINLKVSRIHRQQAIPFDMSLSKHIWWLSNNKN